MGPDPRPAVLAVERRDLAVDSIPIYPAGKQNQLVLHIDNLIQPRPKQTPVLFGCIVLSDAPQNHGTQQKGIHIQNCKVWVLKLPVPAISDPSGEAPSLRLRLTRRGLRTTTRRRL